MSHHSAVLLAAETVSRYVKKVPGTTRLLRSTGAQRVRYWLALHFERRESFTFTQFERLPTQYRALTGPVLDFLNAARRSEPLRIVVLGCSTGAEPYSISSVLLERRPTLAVTIDAYDLDESVLSIASAATYAEDSALSNPMISPEFVANTFERQSGHLVVKPAVAGRVRFHHADLLDSALPSKIAAADIVYAQNILCNMSRSMARRAFSNIAVLLKPRAVLFADGMDLDMRSYETRARNLKPLPFELETIHNEARLVRGERYPWFATGLEPFSSQRPDQERRYSTIFVAGA